MSPYQTEYEELRKFQNFKILFVVLLLVALVITMFFLPAYFNNKVINILYFLIPIGTLMFGLDLYREINELKKKYK